MAFDDISQSPLAELCSPFYKLNIASDANSAILKYQNKEKINSKLKNICKMLSWSQKRLDKSIVFPKINLSYDKK